MADFLFQLRQEWFITMSLSLILYGKCSVHCRRILLSLLIVGGWIGMYTTLVVFLFYFFRKFASPAHRGLQVCTLTRPDLRFTDRRKD
jgi:hypothetical protein